MLRVEWMAVQLEGFGGFPIEVIIECANKYEGMLRFRHIRTHTVGMNITYLFIWNYLGIRHS